MPAPKSILWEKRKPFAPVDLPPKLYKKVVDACLKMPKRYTYLILQDVVQLAGRIMDNAKAANSVFPTNQHEAQIRRDYWIYARADLEALSSRIDRFLKVRFFITETGKVIRRTGRHLAANERKKLRAYRKFLDLGLMTFDEIYLNFHSWLMSLRPFHTFHLVYNIIQYFNFVFREYKNYRPTKLNTRKYKVIDYISRIAAKQAA